MEQKLSQTRLVEPEQGVIFHWHNFLVVNTLLLDLLSHSLVPQAHLL